MEGYSLDDNTARVGTEGWTEGRSRFVRTRRCRELSSVLMIISILVEKRALMYDP